MIKFATIESIPIGPLEHTKNRQTIGILRQNMVNMNKMRQLRGVLRYLGPINDKKTYIRSFEFILYNKNPKYSQNTPKIQPKYSQN